MDLVDGDAGRARHDDCALIGIWSGPRIQHLAVAEVGGAVVRLERRVRRRTGTSRCCRRRVAADASASRRRPSCAASPAAPPAASGTARVSVALLSAAYGPSSHCTTERVAALERRPRRVGDHRDAGHQERRVVEARRSRRLSRTPGDLRAPWSHRSSRGRPPNTGHLAMAANFMSGRRTSMPNSGWPVTTLRLSAPFDARADQVDSATRP